MGSERTKNDLNAHKSEKNLERSKSSLVMTNSIQYQTYDNR